MKLDYQPGLDGLRAVAVIMVLVFHSGLGWLPGGLLGVSVFFTLSGFLITSLLVAEHQAEGRIDLPAFWERRFRRLLPAALITIIGVSLASIWLSTPIEQSRLRGDAIAAVFYASNWRSIWAELSYEEIFSSASPLIHLWSLSIEEQMYVIVPVVAVAILKLTRQLRTLAYVTGALALGSAAVAAFAVEGDRLYYGTDARAAELLVGVVAAALVGTRVMSGGVQLGRISRWLPVGALVGIVWLAYASSTNSPWVYAGFLSAFALVSLVCVVGAIVPGPLRTLLSVPPLVAIGKLSYGLYLFHWPIFTWMDSERLGFGGVGLFALRLAATTAVTGISYRLIEKPIRMRTMLSSRRALIIGMGAMTSIAVIVPLTALESVSTRTSAQVQVLSTVPTAESTFEPGDPAELRQVLVIGDSTAENIARALASAVTDELDSFGVVSAGVLGCPLVAAVEVFDRPRASQESTYCPDNLDIVRTYASRVDALLIVGGVANQWAYRTASGARIEPGSDEYRRDYDDLMNSIQGIVAPWGVPVIVLDNPLTRPDEGVLGDEPEAHGAWRAQIERWDDTWESIGRISIDDVLAPPESEAGRTQRPDGVHLEEVFAAELARNRLVPDLMTVYADMIARLDDIGCRVTGGVSARFDLELCRVGGAD